MVIAIRERQITYISILIVFIGFISALMYRRVDHIYRTLVALVGLSIPLILHKKASDPPKKLEPVLMPLYNEKTMMILGIFIAIHVSLVNVPFTTMDLFHKEWTDADMISHFLGGLTVWLILTEILNHLNLSERKTIEYSFLIFIAACVGWEIAEKLSESEISFIHETLLNKARDLVMDVLGALFGLHIVKNRGYPFELNQDIR
ncbi:MAG: hypothetical protein J7K57_07560 [Palaeococcus sp.]|nr:hypothetical protein [Palaeococcus sp. (in: euryarchaeotes)]MCD6559706.1 hypothetical protein [Palaeococcus sp. (in: euryarchaeotes)]